MQAIVGVFMIMAGIVLGLYLGVWVCFIGGIVDVIEAIRAENLVTINIAVGVAKVVFAQIVGYFSAMLLVIPGVFMVQDS